MEQLNNNEYNILVVEDDKEIRDGIEIFLKSQGYHVYKAADGVEGLQIIEKEQIHLAIVDIMMPRMDGVTMTMTIGEMIKTVNVRTRDAEADRADRASKLSRVPGRGTYL